MGSGLGNRALGALRSHDLHDTYTFQLPETSGRNSVGFRRHLGHTSGRYLALCTNPLEEVTVGYIEDLDQGPHI